MMVDIVRDAIAADIATLTRVLPAPTGDLGFGSDLSCDVDLADGMVELAGTDPLVIAQAVFRRFVTPRGSIPDAPDDGLDLMAWVSRGTITPDIRALAGQARAEALKDDRVANALVTASPSPAGDRLSVTVRIEPADRRVAPFTMVLAVTSAEVLLEEIRR